MKGQKMYGIVMRHLSGIQKGIQFGHAALVYQDKYKANFEAYKIKPAKLPFIILQAVTSDELEETAKMLKSWGIDVVNFYEPDFSNALTGIAFLLDERVYDTDKYPVTKEGVHKELAADDNRLLKIRNLVKKFPLATN
jgi:hypothetical protein